jgi:acetyl esterase/lipase
MRKLCPLLLIVAIATLAAAGAFAQDNPKAPAPPENVIFEGHVEYCTAAGQKLHIDIARPAKLEKPAPCILFIHGGAWRGGDKALHIPQTFEAARRGYVSATVQYRFCPKHTFPAQIEDVKCAVRYLRANAEKYQLDPKRIGAIGYSAGAHLSMLLGTMGEADGLEGEGGYADQKSQVQAVVAYFGPTELAAEDFPDVSKGLLKDFLGGLPADVPEQYKRASPVTYATKGDAPLLIFQGTKDRLVPHTQAFKMTHALTAAGVPGRVELLVGADHGWGGEDLARTSEESLRFFDRYLKRN